MDLMNKKLLTASAEDVAPRKTTSYPEPFASKMVGREKRALGDVFAIKNFGVNLTRLAPQAQSSLLHCHSKQEEFIYILEGEPTLVSDVSEITLKPGMCAGFIPGGIAHHLVNNTSKDVVYIEVGNRIKGDEVYYPSDDLAGVMGADGKWHFSHKNGEPY